MARARQRLRDRRGGTPAVRADLSARFRRSAPRTPACRADGILLLSEPEEPGYVARLRIFNPDGSEAELSGNGAREAIMYLRRHDWTDADSFLDPDRGGRHPAADHLEDRVHGRHGPRAAPKRRLPGGRRGRPRRAGRGRADLALPARSGRQPAVRDPGRRRGASCDRSTCRRSDPGSSITSCSPTARTSLGSRSSSRAASARGSSSAASGRRRRAAPAPPGPPWPMSSTAGARRSRSCSTAASSGSRWEAILTSSSRAGRCRCYRGTLAEEFLEELHATQ